MPQLMPRRRRISSTSANSSSNPALAPALALPLVLALAGGSGRDRADGSIARPWPVDADFAGARRRSGPETRNNTAASPASATPAHTLGENTNPSAQSDTAGPASTTNPPTRSGRPPSATATRQYRADQH